MRKKKLYRSDDNRILFGVCGGIAEYFGIDAAIVRLVWAAFTLLFGLGLILYILAVFIIPKEPLD